MTKPEQDAAEQIAKRLCGAMPGMPDVKPWLGDFDDYEQQAPEHWRFCLAIAEEMVRLSGRVFVKPD